MRSSRLRVLKKTREVNRVEPEVAKRVAKLDTSQEVSSPIVSGLRMSGMRARQTISSNSDDQSTTGKLWIF